MQVFKSGFFKRCTSVALTGSMAVGMMAAMAGAPAMAASSITGVACAPGVGSTPTAVCTVPTGTIIVGTPISVPPAGTITAQTGNVVFTDPAKLVPGSTVPFRVLTTVTATRNSSTGWNLTATEIGGTVFSDGGSAADMILDANTPVTVGCAALSTCTGTVTPLAAASGTGDGFDLVTAGTAGTVLASTGITTATARGVWNVYAQGVIPLPVDAAGTINTNLIVTLAYSATTV